MKRINDCPRYYLLRIKLEKLKQVTWILIVLAKLLPFLAALVAYYTRRS